MIKLFGNFIYTSKNREKSRRLQYNLLSNGFMQIYVIAVVIISELAYTGSNPPLSRVSGNGGRATPEVTNVIYFPSSMNRIREGL